MYRYTQKSLFPSSKKINKTRVRDWLNKNYELLKIISRRVTKEENIDDLLQMVIEQLLKNKKFLDIENEKERIYFFTRVVKNNFYSKSSPYYYEYGRHRFYDFSGNDSEYSKEAISIKTEEEEIDLDWVKRELKKIKDSEEWYYGRLFELYLEVGCSLTKLSEKTTIPINSVSRDINKIRTLLRKKRNELL